MELPSILLRQHIGTVELWLEKARGSPLAKELQELGGGFDSGLNVTLPDIEARMSPTGIQVRWETLSENDRQRLLKAADIYSRFLLSLDSEMIKHSEELPGRIKSLTQSLIEEQTVEGGKLWYRDSSGVWHICFQSFEDGWAYFKVLDNVERQEGKAKLNRMRLYLTYPAALSNEGGGYHVKR